MPVPLPDWEREHSRRLWGTHPEQHLLRWFGRHYAQAETCLTFLDVGCGVGASAGFLLERGHRVVAVDASETALFNMTRRLGFQPRLRALCCDAANLAQVSDGEVDAVVDVMCLAHQEDEHRLAVLREIDRVARGDARLFSMVPCVTSDREPFTKYGHCEFFNRWSVEQTFGGWDVELGYATCEEQGIKTAHWLVSGFKRGDRK